MQGIQEGKFSSGSLRDFKADIDLDLGEGYSANLGYNQYIGDLRQDLKLTLSKKF